MLPSSEQPPHLTFPLSAFPFGFQGSSSEVGGYGLLSHPETEKLRAGRMAQIQSRGARVCPSLLPH